jgi:CNT family concentrative nucleoside transporter
VLYHWGILQRMVQFVATIMRYCMKTSGSETLAAAANIFMGQTEAPLLVRPYIGRMTQSELMCLMTGGMATIAGGVGAVYAELGRQAGYPDMAGHLLTASVMSAPATLLVAKLMMPEKEQPETAKCVPRLVERTTSNTIDAMCKGAADGMKLSINVVAMLIAFVAVVALLNFVFQKVQVWLGCASPITLQTVVGWLNMPFAWLMGVPAKDCLVVGQALGERIVLNEFIGYLTLTSNAASLTDRGFVLGTYALCGFANFGSVAIQVGGIGALVPERRADLAKLGLRAMVAGTLACYITACIVGILT